MRVLLTGGAGFIGSHLVRACLEAGDEVRVLDDLSSGKRANVAGLARDVELVEADVVEPEGVARAARGCDTIFHLAAIASVPQSLDDPVGTHRVNVLGTLHVLEAAKRAGVRRVVFSGSTAVYGDGDAGARRETDPTDPRSPYALQKLAAERYCALYARTLGQDAVTLRYFNVYGPRQDANAMYAGVIPKFVAALVAGERARIFGDGAQSRDFVHVRDVVAANRAAAAVGPDAAGEAFNVGTGTRTTLLELLAAIADALHVSRSEPIFGPERGGDVRHSLADVSKAKRVLGWQPRIALAEGLKDTVRWYADGARA